MGPVERLSSQSFNQPHESSSLRNHDTDPFFFLKTDSPYTENPELVDLSGEELRQK